MKIGAVILAAGAGRRMGGVAKALLRRGEQTFLARIIDTARAVHPLAAVDPLAVVVVVVGPPFGDPVAAHARALAQAAGVALRVVVNEDPGRGMSSSINLGFAALATTEIDVDPGVALDAAWLWPVDHPDVAPSTLDLLRSALDTHDVARPVHDGRGGHPPLVRRALFGELARCAIARDVINAANRIDVAVEDRGTIEDVDR